MKAKITFEKFARYADLGERPNLYIYMRFSQCTYDEFHAYIEDNKIRLDHAQDIGYSDKVIIFVKYSQ